MDLVRERRRMGSRGMSTLLAELRRVFLVVAGLAGLFQLLIVGGDYALPAILDSWALRQLPAWERAAIFEEGEEFAGFISFLRSQVPEDGRVILAPAQTQKRLAHIGYMQYFLFPRDIHNCGAEEVDECILRVVGPKTYIMALPGFPPRDLAERSKRYVPFTDEYGVFAPE
jgi:hypothetical protein